MSEQKWVERRPMSEKKWVEKRFEYSDMNYMSLDALDKLITACRAAEKEGTWKNFQTGPFSEYYEDHDRTFMFGYRLETDQEQAIRESQEQANKEAQEERERREFERLKEKYK